MKSFEGEGTKETGSRVRIGEKEVVSRVVQDETKDWLG